MVVYKGTQRLFDKIFEEPSTSTGTVRTLAITGVTAYSNLSGVILDILSYATGGANATLNINNLGAIPIKKMNENGVLEAVSSDWIIAKQVYSVLYINNSFMLIGSQAKQNILEGSSAIIALTSSSTVQDIDDALGGIEYFMNNILLDKILVISESENVKVVVNYLINYNGNNEITSVVLEFIYNGYYYKQTYAVSTSTGLITGVTVIQSSVENPAITVENDLTSDSQVNPPSVHAVNAAIGQIDALLNQILGV